MNDCIFCKIIAKEIPCYQVYEDMDHLAFLDIKPLNPGHVLVVPKKHLQWHHDLSEVDYLKLMSLVRKISIAQVKALNAVTVSILTMGFEVPHVHIQLIPRWLDDDHRYKGIDVTATKTISQEKMQQIANQIYQNLKS